MTFFIKMTVVNLDDNVSITVTIFIMKTTTSTHLCIKKNIKKQFKI